MPIQPLNVEILPGEDGALKRVLLNGVDFAPNLIRDGAGVETGKDGRTLVHLTFVADTLTIEGHFPFNPPEKAPPAPVTVNLTGDLDPMAVGAAIEVALANYRKAAGK